MLQASLIILTLGTMSTLAACGNTAETVAEPPGQQTTYVNLNGDEISLEQVSDSTMHALFTSSEGRVFDTLMIIDHDFSLLAGRNSLPFLRLQTGGIQLLDNGLRVHDFAGPAWMAMYTGIEEIYDFPFYKTGEIITISDEIVREKGGVLIDGIYLAEGSEQVNEYVHLTGVVKKEKYPREYYSTPDSPQGMFSDTTVDHYRLVVHDYTIEPVQKQLYKGTAITIDGCRALIWEFAHSEAYYLDEQPCRAWEEQENKTITVEAVLVQQEGEKSLLKAWRIVE